jgi:proteasome alpha subunit
MTVPFYVSPQQVLNDRAEYAKKGIARGRSILCIRVSEGILFVAENPMRTLHKIAEIYDRIGFAAVGRYNEFESLRVAGVRKADLTGYAYSREDVTARGLAGVYAQTLGHIFTTEMKPMEVELLVAEVGDGEGDGDHMYRVTFDGQITDETGYVAIGGAADDLADAFEESYEDDMSSSDALEAAVQALANQAERSIAAADLEVAMLDRTAKRRSFRRLDVAALVAMLGAETVDPVPESGEAAPADE